MLDGKQIQEISRRAAVKAAKGHLKPFIVEAEDFNKFEDVIRHIPFLGDFVPKGFKQIDTLFVDTSGFGDTYEPALSFRQFCGEVRRRGVGFGNAITEHGQFQAFVGIYREVI